MAIIKPNFLLKGNNQLKEDEAANHAKEVMENLYKDEEICWDSLKDLDVGNQLSEEAKKLLEKPLTIKEITEAIKYTPNRASGPSGMSIIFFKRFASELAPLLCRIANEILLEGKSATDFLLAGNIVLIPKKKDSQNINDLRPITLLEVYRKVITKAMVERLKVILEKEDIINYSQFCHPGRKIHENIMTLNLIINKFKKERKDLHALFLDFNKSLNRTNHHNLLRF